MFFALIWLCLFPTIFGKCTNSYMTFCDCIRDIREEKKCSEVVIGDLNTQVCPSISITDFTFLGIEGPKILYILNQVIDIEKNSFANSLGESLKFLKIYGNSINNLRTSALSGFKNVEYLGLPNNKIKTIEKYTFSNSEIGVLDLSNNQLQAVAENTFQNADISKIYLQNNRLTYLSSECFNPNLQSLHLDYNNLESLGKFAENIQLKILTVSHNKLNHLSELAPLENIKHLDFSFNRINSISFNQFEDLKDLEFLNLNKNQLQNLPLEAFKKMKTSKLRLFVNYNLLTDLKIDNIKPITLTLFGNPWNCKCIDQIIKKMYRANFTTTQCDQKLFSIGELPICLEQGPSCTDSPVENQIDLGRFLEVVNGKINNLPCNLFEETSIEYTASILSPA